MLTSRFDSGDPYTVDLQSIEMPGVRYNDIGFRKNKYWDSCSMVKWIPFSPETCLQKHIEKMLQTFNWNILPR